MELAHLPMDRYLLAYSYEGKWRGSLRISIHRLYLFFYTHRRHGFDIDTGSMMDGITSWGRGFIRNKNKNKNRKRRWY